MAIDVDLEPYRRPNARFAFHTTTRENVASIRRDRIRQSAACNADTETTTEALASRGYEEPFPFERDAVVYCHPDSSYVKAVSGLFDGFANDEVVVVVDLNAVSAPLYLTDMTAASELIDHHVASDAATTTETFDEAVQQYRESIVRFDGIDAIPDQIGEINGYPELVVDGDIPVEAIVDVRG